MVAEKDDNQRIVRNTTFLTIRMLIVIVISLYTARVIIDTLGVEDFGIYSIVAGVVGFLGVLNGSLVSASQRFLSFELGKTSDKNFNAVLNSLLFVFIVIGLFSVIIGLAIKGWLIDSILVFPPEKKDTVAWLYYFSLGAFCINLLSIPYMASVVSHERMGMFAYAGMLEAVLKLLTAWALIYVNTEKLFLYGLLNLLVTIIISFYYVTYNFFAIKETSLQFYWNKKILRQLYAYTGWSLFGSVTSILNLNGQALMLNTFFGPIVNAAKAISDRINSIIAGFSNNFYTAVRPQLIKKYASNDIEGMLILAYNSTKYAFFILFIIGLPMIIFMQELLDLWLGEKNVTAEMVLFSKLIIVFSLLNTFEQPVTAMIQATGSVKRYEMTVGAVTLLLLPLSYFAYKLGLPSHSSIAILIALYAIAQIFRLYIAKKQVCLSYIAYLSAVIFPVFRVAIVVIIAQLSIKYFLYEFHFILNIFICFLLSALVVYNTGINAKERIFIKNILWRKLRNE